MSKEQPGDQQARAYEGFKGKVSHTYADSEPWWPERPEAPEGAPNILIVLMEKSIQFMNP